MAAGRVLLPSWVVSAVVVAPLGARPSYAQGYYNRDNAFYTAWDSIAKDRGRFQQWLDENILHATAA
jgi:glutaconate CoA-transferase subunit A